MGAGLDGPNADMLDALAVLVRSAGKPWVIAADWQNTPDELAATGWVEAVAGAIAACGLPTCYGAGQPREFDLFVIDKSLQPLVRGVGVDLTAPFRPP